MTKQAPSILNNDDFLNSDINVKWGKDSKGYFLFKVQNEKLLDIVLTLNHKAIIGLTAALSEWIFWRISKIFSIESITLNTDVLWLGQIDKRYINNSQYGNEQKEDIYDDILWVLFGCLDEIRYNYTIGSYRIIYRVVNLAMLARYITPNPSVFDTWLADVLKRATKLFPAQYNRQDVRDHPKKYPEFYDSSNEPPIPREFFFEPDFDYETANIDELLSAFMQKVDHSNPLYFKPAKEMIAEGFVGIPYVYPQPK
ncbi:hypothetical protein RCS94_06345 [Orbaceae bacterium ac157xtp]